MCYVFFFFFSSWKKPQFDEKSVRLVLFRDSDGRGREIIFDSKCVKEEEKVCHFISFMCDLKFKTFFLLN
jgi:hypothetical protein